jgi:VanZ family protein
MQHRPGTLARLLLAVYVLLVAYGSLYPLTGWRDQGLSPFAFLGAPLPVYFTAFDVALNVAAYLPLGALAALAVRRLPRAAIVLIATALGAATSVALEAAQSFLPDRIPSNLDLAANVAGTLLGAAVGIAVIRPLAAGGVLHALRTRTFRAGAGVDLGLVLAGLWVFSQLNPETLLFGNGSLHGLVGSPPTELHPAATFARFEAAVAAANLFAVSLFTALLVADGGPRRRVVALLVLAALAARTVAFGVLFAPDAALAWFTPGAAAGLAVGGVLALALLALPQAWAVALCGLALMAATVIVNLAPENPYLVHSLAVWRQGHFLNFNGLTRTVSILWPFAALAYLLAVATRGRAGR